MSVTENGTAIVDAEVVEDLPPTPSDAHTASTEVVRRERRSEVIKPLDAGELVESFRSYQELLPKLLDDSDYQSDGKDKFVKKSGWRKIATAFDLDVQLIRSHAERDASGEPVRAEVWARAIAPSGRSMDGDGYCAISEKRFANARGRQKLENDLRATATTRAMNRAISGLVGMGAVSAEEMDAGGSASAPGLPFGPAASDERIGQLERAFAWMLRDEPDSNRVQVQIGQIRSLARNEYIPEIAAKAVLHAIAALKRRTEQVIAEREAQRESTSEDADEQADEAAQAALDVEARHER